MAELNKCGHYALVLHGSMDQIDREQSISDFKNGLRHIMIATSVAGRGLDVRDLKLVINFDCPNHLEDYVCSLVSLIFCIGTSCWSYWTCRRPGYFLYLHYS